MSSSASGMKAAKLLAKAAKLGGKAAFKKAAAGAEVSCKSNRSNLLAAQEQFCQHNSRYMWPQGLVKTC